MGPPGSGSGQRFRRYRCVGISLWVGNSLTPDKAAFRFRANDMTLLICLEDCNLWKNLLLNWEALRQNPVSKALSKVKQIKANREWWRLRGHKFAPPQIRGRSFHGSEGPLTRRDTYGAAFNTSGTEWIDQRVKCIFYTQQSLRGITYPIHEIRCKWIRKLNASKWAIYHQFLTCAFWDMATLVSRQEFLETTFVKVSGDFFLWL